MATKKIALDAGHGLKTAGKQTPDGIKEWSLNDKVRDKIVALLKDYDVTFVFPDNDEGNVDEGLTARRTMYLKEKVDAAVSIHHNAFTGTWGSATGVGVYIDKKATRDDEILAKEIYNRLVKNTGLKGRGVNFANFTVINQNTIPAVLVEGGFMDNKKDYALITSDKGQTAYAKAVADALVAFLALKKKKKTTAQVAPTHSAAKVAKESAKDFDKKLAGTYKVTASALNVRSGAGTGKSIMISIPKGTKVTCYGYYTTIKGTKWLYIQFTYNRVLYTGFASSKYLAK